MPRVIFASAFALLLFAGGSFLFMKESPRSATSLSFNGFNPNPGKANLPIQIQIKHSEINADENNVVEIRAQFSVNQPEDDILYRWELPEGTVVLEGDDSGTKSSAGQGRHEAWIVVRGLVNSAQARVGFRVQTKKSGYDVFRVGSIVTQPENTWENYGPDIKKASDLLKSKAEENFQ